jgi:hypothetical protein
VAGSRPTLFKLLEALLGENVRVNALAVRVDVGEEILLYSRPQYQTANERLKNLIATYHQKTADQYLTACSYYVLNN